MVGTHEVRRNHLYIRNSYPAHPVHAYHAHRDPDLDTAAMCHNPAKNRLRSYQTTVGLQLVPVAIRPAIGRSPTTMLASQILAHSSRNSVGMRSDSESDPDPVGFRSQSDLILVGIAAPLEATISPNFV